MFFYVLVYEDSCLGSCLHSHSRLQLQRKTFRCVVLCCVVCVPFFLSSFLPSMVGLVGLFVCLCAIA